MNFFKKHIEILKESSLRYYNEEQTRNGAMGSVYLWFILKLIYLAISIADTQKIKNNAIQFMAI